ncbi:MAG TPA: carbon monoxide dehydrogenase [Alphaproteobacteria bacterium]|nr:carbon monoxide dehydrogenase [Alphaproteobacteria bacterium]
MYAFSYHRATTVADAKKAFSSANDAKFLAGGQTLLPTMKARLASPSDLIDLMHVQGFAGISVDTLAVTIGAGTTHATVHQSKDVSAAIPALSALAGGIGDPAVRHRGTIGGSLANNDPAADYPAAALGLGATIKTDNREIRADDFFTGMFSTALEEGEIITAVMFPRPKRAAYMKFPNPASRYALTGVFVAETAHGPRVAVTGAGSCVFRVTAMEQALAKSFKADAIAAIKVPAAGLNTDLHATAEYRAHLITVMAKRAVALID